MKVPDAPYLTTLYFLTLFLSFWWMCVDVLEVTLIYIFLIINDGVYVSYVNGHLAIFGEKLVHVFLVH